MEEFAAGAAERPKLKAVSERMYVGTEVWTGR